MSHEYMKCKGCGNPVMEHLMNHTSKGSYCDACYKRLGLQPSDEELGFITCSICGETFLKRNFKSAIPDDMCKKCFDKNSTKNVTVVEERGRDVSFYSEKNQNRDIVLGFIHDKDDKRVGMRILRRATNRVETHTCIGTWCTWNLNIHEDKFYPKCCKLSEFPVLSLPNGVDGNPMDSTAKLMTKVSGAWVLEELSDRKLRLVSVSGQMKDVTEETALNFHKNYKIANVVVTEDGKLDGMYKKYEREYGTDVFELFGDGRVHWYYYNPDGYGGNGQYVENNFDTNLIREVASRTNTAETFFDLIGSEAKQYIIDNDGSEAFESLRKSITTEKFNIVGCDEKAWQTLLVFASVKENAVPQSEDVPKETTVDDKEDAYKDKFFATGENLRKQGYEVLWLTRSMENAKVRYDLTYMSKQAILSAAKKGLSPMEFFEDSRYRTGGYFLKGDAKYDVIESTYAKETEWTGLSVETMKGIIEFVGGTVKYTSNTNSSNVKVMDTQENQEIKVDYKEVPDKFIVDEENRCVVWLYYEPGGMEFRGDANTYSREQFVSCKATFDELLEAKSMKHYSDYFEYLKTFIYKTVQRVYKGEPQFLAMYQHHKSVAATYVGYSEETMKALLKIASKEPRKLPDTTVVTDKTVKLTPNQADLDAMKALNEELKAASAAYYGDGESPLSDLEYDENFDKLRNLEMKTGVILPDSVTQGVGTEVKGKLPKVEHVEKLLSLDKTKAVDTLKDLLGLDSECSTGVLSWKMDGLTVLLQYSGGVLKQAVTRGNGKIGEDVTHNAKFFKGVPRRIPYKGELRVRGEAVISYATFERINVSLPEGQEPYKNPRNLASGMVRRSEVTKDGSVEFIPFGVVIPDEKFRPETYAQSLKFLLGQGFTPVQHKLCTAANLDSLVAEFKKNIETFEYPTDGLVLMLDSNAVYERLGSTGHHPRGAIAFKWADEKQKTTLRQIEWSASRTGVLTPVAIFDPVELEGTTVKRASVHNLTMLRKLKLGIGDSISIYKANMIIPQIAENHTCSDTVQAPTTCPVCSWLTTTRNDGDSAFVLCTNPDCAAKNVGSLAHFVKREAMNIDGISEKTIQELVSAGFIGKRIDFYNLKNHPEIAELSGWGKSSYNKMLYAIENSRTPRLTNFIYSLGIRNVGRSASETLAKHFGSLDGFLTATADQIGQVDGIGGGMTSDIVDYLGTHTDEIRELASMLTIVNPGQDSVKKTTLPAGVQEGAPNCLNGLVFCVTGKIEFPGARDALAAYIESLGGHMSSAVSKNTNYLITNTPNSGSSKNKKAQAVGCKVISEQSFFLLVKDLSDKMTVISSETDDTETESDGKKNSLS